MHDLDTELEVNGNLANNMATQLWMEALAEKATHTNVSIQTLRCYMNLLAASAPGISYLSTTNDTGLATGLTCMTGTTRNNFERYDDLVVPLAIAIDAITKLTSMSFIPTLKQVGMELYLLWTL